MKPLPSRAQAILDFWFGAPGTPEYTGPRAIWFKKDTAFDAEIWDQHLRDYESARDGACDNWQSEALSSLALVVSLDQFPRNLFRDDPRAFATDAKALAIAQQAIEDGFDCVVMPHQRIFFYLPFEHSEHLLVQEHCMELIKGMPDFEMKNGYYDYAVQHHKIIQRFGRFPHRNAILDRENTKEEREFLRQPDSGF